MKFKRHAFALTLIAMLTTNGIAQESVYEANVAASPVAVQGGTIELYNVSVDLVAEAESIIAAGESGRLLLVPKEGMDVRVDQVIAKTDDAIAREQQRVARYSFEAEKIKLDSDIELRYSTAQSRVRESSYRDALAANEKIRNAVSPNQLDMRKFEWDAAELSIEKTRNDRLIARAAAQVKLAEYDLATVMLERHQIKSPVHGEVTMVDRRVGEWVRPGDPIAKVVRRDKMRIVGYLPYDVLTSPSMLKGKEIEITIPASSVWPAATLRSNVYFVTQEVEGDDKFQVWAEIDNIKVRDGRGQEVFAYPKGMRGVKATLTL